MCQSTNHGREFHVRRTLCIWIFCSLSSFSIIKVVVCSEKLIISERESSFHIWELAAGHVYSTSDDGGLHDHAFASRASSCWAIQVDSLIHCVQPPQGLSLSSASHISFHRMLCGIKFEDSRSWPGRTQSSRKHGTPAPRVHGGRGLCGGGQLYWKSLDSIARLATFKNTTTTTSATPFIEEVSYTPGRSQLHGTMRRMLHCVPD